MFHKVTLLFAVTSIVYAGESPISFGDGGVGVSFLGFKANAGIGSDGKLHAGAGTPWGAEAGAGIEGTASDESSGGLYAGATAGGGVSASAGLAGSISKGGSYGGSYAGASVGEKSVEVIKEKSVGLGGASSFSAEFKSHHYGGPVTKHVQVVKKPVEVGVVEVVHESVHHPAPPPPEVRPVTTVIQKTVIPNYEKKIIKVPSYEEKVVRVPTTVEKEIWVPAAPTVIEKEVHVEQPVVHQPPPTVVQTVETVPVVYKTKFHKRPFFRKHFSFGIGNGYAGGYNGGYNGGYSGGYSGGYEGDYSNYGGAGGSAGATYSASVSKTANPQLFNDIFNIPVSTLGAVNKLLTNAASGASGGGSFGFSKSINLSKSVGGGGYASASSY
ncbi:uncharacterized protein LOC123684456 [Harmonia axyridis]|uniref:uncharacterized protein LOC123684456 n=1 Tax=Harmonia axyridis TaxID=115357 RepID=UPI001E277FE1|nr:uncharacterized protein LOC123684456 [Harmonia axyridis]XP_045479684.1 uncharacterized protein LOC123684456 [Harmonia axyridis]